MSCKWPQKPLGELLELVIDHRGKTPKKMGFSDFHSEGHPVLSAKHVKTDVLVNVEAIRFANEQMYHKWMKVEIQEGDVVLTSEAPMGEVYYLDGNIKYVLGQRVFGLRPKKEEIHPLYLSAWLTSLRGQEQLAARASGSTVLGIKQSELLKIEVDLPPYEIQEQIAKVRYDFTKKIAINTQTNQTLEQIAQAIFKSWFVDFEPVKAKMAVLNSLSPRERVGVRAKEQAELAAMSVISAKDKTALKQMQAEQPEAYTELAQTAALFPAAMVDSELGEIPEGWKLGTLSNVASFAADRIAVSKVTIKNYVSTENMLENKRGIAIASAIPSGKTVPLFEKGHILVSNIRPYFKKIWFARFNGGRSPDVLGFVSKDPESEEFLFNFLYQDIFFDFMMTTSKGAKMPRGDKDAIMGYELALPSQELRRRYSRLVHSYYEKIENLNNENDTLTIIRDTLLPKLLSGELTLPNTEEA